MKIVVLMDGCDYDAWPIGAFVVPDDFDVKAVREKYAKVTVVPRRWSNQHGSGTSTRYFSNTMPFEKWLRERYEEVEIIVEW